MTINGETILTGLIGSDIRRSPSPAMFNAAFRHLGMDWAYLPLRVAGDRLAEALPGLRAAGFSGVNVTIPHKLEAAALADVLEGDAARLRSVNTLRFEDGRTIGYNTDAAGLERSLREAGVDVSGPVLIVGAGGAARAAALALSRLGAGELHILNRSRPRAEEFERLVKHEGIFDETYVEEYGGIGARVLAECSCVVNSTPLARGMPGESPLDYGGFRPGQAAVDLGYLQYRSAFLRAAEERGALAINGRPMLLYQAAEAFRIWTGAEAPLPSMRLALEEELMERQARERRAGGRDGEA